MPEERRKIGTITLYRRDDTSAWWYDFHVAGVRHRRTTGAKDRSTAEGIAQDARQEAVRCVGRPGRGEGIDLATLGGLDVERAAAEGAGESQQASVEACWVHLCRLLGPDTNPATLTYDRLLAYIRTRRQEGARGQSIRKEIQALRRGMAIALRRQHIQATLQEWPKIKSDPPNRTQKGKLHSIPVLQQWLEELERDPRAKGARAQAELVLLTGMRAEEVRRLTWEWVEAAPEGSGVPAVLRLPAEATKTRQERVLGLVPRALELIEEARRAAGVGKWDAILFPSTHRRTFISAAQRVGCKAVSLRDLRHCHATYAAQGTGDAAAAQAALGHADLATTQRYLSSTITRTAAAALAVSEALLQGDRHRKASQPERGSPKGEVKGIGVSGFEPPASCSRSREQGWLEHLSVCPTCFSMTVQYVLERLDTDGCRHSTRHREAG